MNISFKSSEVRSSRLWAPVLGAIALITTLCPVRSVGAADPTQLVVTILQDEALRLPKDNTALFSARSRSIRLSVQYLAETGTPDTSQLTLVTPNGQEEDLVADNDGNFTIPNPVAGIYAIVARTATTAIASVPFYAKQVEENILADAMTESDSTIALPMIEDGREATEQLVEQYVSFRDPEPVDPIRFDFETDEPHGYQVRMTDQGTVNGRVILATGQGSRSGLLADNNLFLLRNGVRIQNTISDASGDFAFVDMTPGIYGIVATGPAGFTAFSFEVLPANALAQDDVELDSMTDAGYVAKKAMAPTSILPVVMIPPELVPAVLRILRRDRIGNVADFPVDGTSTPIVNGGVPSGYPGGSYGGGFGGGGGGGFGGLAEIGALAGFGAILAASDVFDDDDPIFVPQQPVSPAIQ
ncbi:MAG: hypothetical protein AAF989_05890 [Planctomycetota bacterium]